MISASSAGACFALSVATPVVLAATVVGAAIFGAVIFGAAGLATWAFGFSAACAGAGTMPGKSCASAGMAPSKSASATVVPPKCIVNAVPALFCGHLSRWKPWRKTDWQRL